MKKILSLFLIFSAACADAGVTIYKNDTSLAGIEWTNPGEGFTATLYGGSVDAGPATPADCLVKFDFKKDKDRFSGSLIPFQSDIMEYPDTRKNNASIEFANAKISVVVEGLLGLCPLQTDFSGDYTQVKSGDKKYRSDFDTLIRFNHYNAVKASAAGNNEQAVKSLSPYIEEAMKQNDYQPQIYNDYGYFLQKSGQNQQAIKYLTVVKNRSPKRIAVYLNLADACWDSGDKTEARHYYSKYIAMMTDRGESDRIPAQAIERSHQ